MLPLDSQDKTPVESQLHGRLYRGMIHEAALVHEPETRSIPTLSDLDGAFPFKHLPELLPELLLELQILVQEPD